MPRLSLPKLVVAFLLRDGKAMSLDLLARVSLIEGIAGVKPGTWMRNVVPEKEIVEVFGPGVRETWLSPRDSGLVTAVRRAIEPLLKSATTTADDILQPALLCRSLQRTSLYLSLVLSNGLRPKPWRGSATRQTQY